MRKTVASDRCGEVILIVDLVINCLLIHVRSDVVHVCLEHN